MEGRATARWEELIRYLGEKESLAVAFSGGVDSAFLLAAAKEALGERVTAVTVKSCFFPTQELSEAEAFCEERGILHVIVEVDALGIEGIGENPPNRCYICKRAMFTKIIEAAAENGIACVAEASNLDDNNDYRPGLLAVEELGVESPLRAVGFYKREIRACSKELGLPTWEKPALACLASRFVYGETLTAERLRMVEAAERFFRDAGFGQVRVRVHGTLARVEVAAEDFAKVCEGGFLLRANEALKGLGFSYVTLDMGGYRTGSMNDSILK